jgi:pilus assembly protein CpaB
MQHTLKRLTQLSDKALWKIAIAAGVLAMLGVGIYLTDLWRESSFQNQPVYVVVATRMISPQTELLPSDLDLVSVPRKYLQPAALQQLPEAIGRVAATAIPQGSQVTQATTLSPRAHAGIAASVPVGKRAVSIAVDEVNGVAGLIKPSNFVDCMLTLDFGDDSGSRFTTFTLLEKIPVMAVNHDLLPPAVNPPKPKSQNANDMAGPERSDRMLVTVAVSPEESEMLMLAQESGRVHLALRSQEDVAATNPAPMTLDQLTKMRGIVRPRMRPAYMEYRGGR